MNRLTNLVVASLVLTQATFAYRLDPAGHRTHLTEQVNGVARQCQWRHDVLHRLTHETIAISQQPSTINQLRYTYDAVGDRLTRASELPALPPQTLNYRPNDWLITDTYDPNGNTQAGRGVPSAPGVESSLRAKSQIAGRKS